MKEALQAGFLLDRRWHWLRGEMEHSKEPDLALLLQILAREGILYAVIGGVALQVHLHEPRTTLDVDVALRARTLLPRAALLSAGFRETGKHPHSDNWIGPGGTPIQFTDDPALAEPLSRALEVSVGDRTLRVLRVEDLLHEKLRAGADPALRRSKRLQDLADAQALLEQDPSLDGALSIEERALLSRLPN